MQRKSNNTFAKASEMFEASSPVIGGYRFHHTRDIISVKIRNVAETLIIQSLPPANINQWFTIEKIDKLSSFIPMCKIWLCIWSGTEWENRNSFEICFGEIKKANFKSQIQDGNCLKNNEWRKFWHFTDEYIIMLNAISQGWKN